METDHPVQAKQPFGYRERFKDWADYVTDMRLSANVSTCLSYSKALLLPVYSFLPWKSDVCAS